MQTVRAALAIGWPEQKLLKNAFCCCSHGNYRPAPSIAKRVRPCDCVRRWDGSPSLQRRATTMNELLTSDDDSRLRNIGIDSSASDKNTARVCSGSRR